jgi:3-oxoacyl-[acyl-carrier-protein] synthase I
MQRRVVVTGLGLVSCLGHDYSTVLQALKGGVSGIKAMPGWKRLGLKSLVAGPVEDLGKKIEDAAIPKKLMPAMSDAAIFCSLSARAAVADAGLKDEDLQQQRTGCIVGSGIGSGVTIYQALDAYYRGNIRHVDPYSALRSMSNTTSAAVTNLLGILGRSYSVSSACATSAHNIGHAYELIRSGALDRAISGGGEDINELLAVPFHALRLALSTNYNSTPTRASRPYDAGRDGFVLSGGAGIVILEAMECARARGAKIRAEIIGFGANSDAHDMIMPEHEGHQVAACIEMALDSAGILPRDVEYVNTHGTSTPQGDIAEVNALRRVFHHNVPAFSSTKSMTGHAMGAAGALELIFCIAMLEQGFLAPSINIESLDIAFEGLPIVTKMAPQQVSIILTNNLGFGGTNAALILKRCND